MSQVCQYEGPDINSLFPVEILSKLFIDLDHTSFMRCRLVCPLWRNIVDHILFRNEEKLYDRFCNEDYKKSWGHVRHKSISMTCRQIYYNLKMWPKINQRIAENKKCDPKYDHDDSFARFYRLHEIPESTQAYTLNDMLIFHATITNSIFIIDQLLKHRQHWYTLFDNKLYIHRQICSSPHEETIQQFTVPTKHFASSNLETICLTSVKFFKIYRNVCIFLTTTNRLCKLDFNIDPKTNRMCNNVTTLAKWYSSDEILMLEYFKDKIYMMTKTRSILTYEWDRILRVGQLELFTTDDHQNTIDLSVGTYKIFFGKSIIVMYFDLHHVYFKTIYGCKVYKTTAYFITAACYYANMLFLGTDDGKVLIHSIPKESDLLQLEQMPKVYQSSLETQGDHIVGFEILEEYGCHYVVYWTFSNVYYIKFDHFLPND